MSEIIGIRFKSCGRIYDFEANGLEVREGDRIVVESEFGLSIGVVTVGPRQAETPGKEYKKVLRLANEADMKQKRDNENFEKDARMFCNERIMARGLPMRLVCSEVTLDRKRIVFYFTADGRIDFRELVKDLAAKFKTRIEMRQIGVRDKAKLVGGLGLCGRELCCRLFLTSFEPISIKMAKQQELVLNTGKLSGTCGRLMCCLGYEYHEGGVSDVASPPAEATPSGKGEEEIVEVLPEEPLTKEVVCCTVEAAGPAPDQPGGADAGETGKKPEGARKHRRRRRRHRKRSDKNNEQ